MNLWKQSKQHLNIHRTHLETAFEGSSLSNLLAIHSKIVRKNDTLEMSKDPKAMEPKLYLSDHQKPFIKLNYPLVSADEVKYHVQTPHMRV